MNLIDRTNQRSWIRPIAMIIVMILLSSLAAMRQEFQIVAALLPPRALTQKNRDRTVHTVEWIGRNHLPSRASVLAASWLIDRFTEAMITLPKIVQCSISKILV